MANEGKDIVAGVALGNLLEPIDYEGWIDSKISILKKDPHFDLMLFPEDDVEVSELFIMTTPASFTVSLLTKKKT